MRISHSTVLISQAGGLNFAKEMLLSTAESATYSSSEVERRLHSNLRNGLTWQEALSRSKIIGYNELKAPEEDSTLMKYVEQFKNPLILLLLGELEVKMFVQFSHVFRYQDLRSFPLSCINTTMQLALR